MENGKEENFQVEVLTRLAVIESKLDEQKETKDIAYRAYNNTKENIKDINNLKEKVNNLQNEVEGIKDQPRQRWFNLLGTMISIVVTAIVTFILAKIGLD